MSSADRRPFAHVPGDEALTTAMISDSLDAAGVRGNVFDQWLVPLVPGMRVFGRAWTICFEPCTESEQHSDPYGAAIDFISDIRAGEVAVIATEQSNASAFWGELFSAAAIGAGAAGVVTDGNLRDTAKIIGLGFPAFSRSRRPVDYRDRMRVATAGARVLICGVVVEPGDLVIADDDGVVVIPAQFAEDVLQLARLRAAAETTVLADLVNGSTLRSVWDRHGVL